MCVAGKLEHCAVHRKLTHAQRTDKHAHAKRWGSQLTSPVNESALTACMIACMTAWAAAPAPRTAAVAPRTPSGTTRRRRRRRTPGRTPPAQPPPAGPALGLARGFCAAGSSARAVGRANRRHGTHRSQRAAGGRRVVSRRVRPHLDRDVAGRCGRLTSEDSSKISRSTAFIQPNSAKDLNARTDLCQRRPGPAPPTALEARLRVDVPP